VFEFTIGLTVPRGFTGRRFWAGHIGKFVPDVDLTSWRLPARAPTGDLLTDVMAAIRDHGLVALEAAMYEAEHRPDPPRPLRPQMPPGQWQLGQPP
jgi:hypothetical protein